MENNDRENKGKVVAVTLDNRVYTAPMVKMSFLTEELRFQEILLRKKLKIG
jgi:hypothetical protein